MCVHVWSCQSCLTLCDPLDCSRPGPCVHGDSPGKDTGMACHALFKGSGPPRDRTHASYISCIGRWVLYHWRHLGSPKSLTSWCSQHMCVHTARLAHSHGHAHTDTSHPPFPASSLLPHPLQSPTDCSSFIC